VTDYAQLVAHIWERVLGHPTPADQNFFDAGGDSMLLLRVHAELESRLARQVALLDLLRYPTVASLATALAEAGR
jgi:acyl carrier protein